VSWAISSPALSFSSTGLLTPLIKPLQISGPCFGATISITHHPRSRARRSILVLSIFPAQRSDLLYLDSLTSTPRLSVHRPERALPLVRPTSQGPYSPRVSSFLHQSHKQNPVDQSLRDQSTSAVTAESYMSFLGGPHESTHVLTSNHPVSSPQMVWFAVFALAVVQTRQTLV
jgi:hypothetical protein